MVTKLNFACCELAVLTNDWDMSFSFMFRFVCLSYDLATVLALVVDSCALHFVHSELGDFDTALAVFALFGFLSFDHN